MEEKCQERERWHHPDKVGDPPTPARYCGGAPGGWPSPPTRVGHTRLMNKWILCNRAAQPRPTASTH